jgi:two-component system sensor histidine kinase/response regulator
MRSPTSLYAPDSIGRVILFGAAMVASVALTSWLGQWKNSATTVWLPEALLLAGLLLAPLSRLRIYAATGTTALCFSSYFLLKTELPLTVLNGLVTLAFVWGAASLLRRQPRWIEGKDDSLKAWGIFAICALALQPLGLAAVSTFLLRIWTGDRSVDVFPTWLIAAAMGNAIVVPLMLRCRPHQMRRLISERKLARTLLTIGAFAVVAAYALTQSQFLWLFVPLSLALLIAARTGVQGLSVAMLALTVLAIWAVRRHLSPFETITSGNLTEEYALAQLYVLLVWAACYLVAALIYDRQQDIKAAHSGSEIQRAIERRTAEEALRDSQERFRMLVEHAADDFFLHDERGYFIDVNQRACVNTGYSREELLTMKVDDISNDRTREENLKIWASTAPGVTASLRSNHIRKDGSVFPVEVRITCQVFQGKKYFLGMVRDITERVEAERAIRKLNAELEQRVIERTEQWQKSARLLKGVMDATSDLIFVKDRAGRYLLCNAAIAKLMGRPLEHILGKTDQEILGESAADLPENDRLVMERGQPAVLTERTLINGVEHIFQTTKGPHRDEAGNTIGIFGIGRDITEVAQAEAAFRDSEARWQFALDGSGDGVWDWNVETNRVFYSRQWAAMLGYQDNEVGSTTEAWSKLIHPDDLARCWHTINEHFQGNAPVFTLEHRMLAKDGSWRWILDRGKVVERKADGSPQRVIGTHTDITKRKLAEENLRVERERLSLATTASQQGLWDLDAANGVLIVDARWCQIMGFGEGITNVTIEQATERIHPADRDEVNEATIATLRTGHDFQHSIRIVTPDGKLRWIRSTARPSQSADGSQQRLVGFIQDITESVQLAESLQRSNESLKAAERLARIGSWTWDIPTDHAVWSTMLYELFQMDPAVTAPKFDELQTVFTPESFQTFAQVAGHCVKYGTPYSVDLEGVRRDGSRIFVNAMGEATRDAHGQVVRVSGTIHDITERKQTERALRESEARWQFALEGAGDGIWEWKFALDTLSPSLQGRALLGYDPQDDMDCSLAAWNERIHPEDLPRLNASFGAHAEGKTPMYSCEYRIRTKQGLWRWFLVRGKIIERSSDDLPSLAIGTMADVTERKESENALRALSERTQLAVKAAGVGIWELDLQEGRFIWDEQMHTLHGLRPGEFSGLLEDWLKLMHHEDSPRIREEWQRSLSQAIFFECEFRIIKQSGETRHIREMAQVFCNARGEPARALGTNWDVTTERQSAAALQKAAATAAAAEHAKGEFLAMMSHEIRTPMNTVLGMVRLTLQTELTPKQHNYLSKINLSAKALINIINDILDFSKIEAGKMSLEIAEFAMESLLESVSAVTAMKAEEKGLEIIYDIDDQVPATLTGDALRVGQVLINLVNNAVKFTEKGEVVVSAYLTGDAQTGQSMLEFAVRDTGIGLDKRQIDRLFEAFSQAHASTTQPHGGTGLGLVICKRLVSMMGGTIWVESEVGRGSIFRFTIPSHLPPRTTASPFPSRWSHALAGRRVLIVDDNASYREVLSHMVHRFGMEAATAPSGLSAMEILQQASAQERPFEVVLMDWRMPGMDGLEAARLIKQDTNLAQIPAVLMVTAFAREEVLRRAEQLGLDGVLIKPVTDSVLFNTITDAFGSHHALSKTKALKILRDLNRLRGRHALIVEDNALNREVTTEFLHQAGMEVTTAANGLEALTLLKGETFDIILMDLQMAGMDGQETARIIREDATLAPVPILALTGDTTVKQLAHMDEVLLKPIDADLLFDALLRWLPKEPALSGLVNRHILVVDDNALNREVVTDFLLAVGVKVDSAVDGLEALARISKFNYDAVLLDVQMPKMSGLQAAREIRRQPRWRHLPLIALTAQAQEEDRAKSMSAGMNAHLTKPIDEHLLYRTLLSVMRPITPPDDASLPPFATDAQDDSIPWPTDLPGIDLNLALSRLGGKQRRVLRMFQGFIRDFGLTPPLVKNDLAAGRYLAVADAVHTIKSAAAYLGATELANAADAVEESARSSHTENLPALVTTFLEKLDVVLGGLNGLQNPLDTDNRATSSLPDVDKVLQLIETTKPFVLKGDYAAVALLDEISSLLVGTSLSTLAESACTSFEDLDLVQTDLMLGSIRDALTPPQSPSSP